MAIFTRFAQVLDAQGKPLTVREALALINATLDDALAEQEYLERARGLPPETASEIAVRIAEEQGPTSMR